MANFIQTARNTVIADLDDNFAPFGKFEYIIFRRTFTYGARAGMPSDFIPAMNSKCRAPIWQFSFNLTTLQLTAADVKLAKCAHFEVKSSICCFALFFNSMTTSGFRHITSSFKNQRFHWFCVKQEIHFWRALNFSTARLPVTNKRVHSRISNKNIAL